MKGKFNHECERNSRVVSDFASASERPSARLF
ncbi:hypothetical protein I656_02815 [Geobacillus sp. WSUCF1]|nr:hypothetical protein I656_02815 [Geobacillus sp. WSUCF1]